MHMEGESLCRKMMTVLLTLQGNHVFTYHEVDKTTFGSPLQKVIPWKFTYNVTYSFPKRKKAKKKMGKSEPWISEENSWGRNLLDRITKEVIPFLLEKFKITAPIQPCLISSKPQSRLPSLPVQNSALLPLNWIWAFVTKLNGICRHSVSYYQREKT